MSEESDFEKYRPKVNQIAVTQAAKAYGRGDEILSLDGSRTALDAFILLLATDAATRGPFLMNAACSRELCALLVAAGFGP